MASSVNQALESEMLPPWKMDVQVAQIHAQSGRFEGFLATCQHIVDANGSNVDALMHVGSLLLSFGFLSAANRCFTRASVLAPTRLGALMNVANAALEAGDQVKARQLYTALVEHLPDNAVIRRNALVGSEYDPARSDDDRLAQANAWGTWAMTKAGGPWVRPATHASNDRPLRLGYVSADFCHHTVGLFIKDVLIAHDQERVRIFAYSAGATEDWVTAAIQNACVFRRVSGLDDVALAEQIRQDKIDVLIDLSGHTGGSRLTMFAYRPAPVQVSWLGYFATTGLPVMDAVLLDDWHAPSGTEAHFVERVVRLPHGRFCYVPVSFAPQEVAAPPSLAKGYITFGSFNNTAKLNSEVYDLWAQVLAAVPNSRLLLKWRTFHDEPLCEAVRSAFAARGIDPARIELRGASFHADVLKQYADIDIALDPFPFTGGLTSCEALWMGVPVVTWPQSRVVSRQTFAFLSVIGLAELAADNANNYVGIAVGLANDPQRLTALRREMRSKMEASPLCDVKGFTSALEDAYLSLAAEIALL